MRGGEPLAGRRLALLGFGVENRALGAWLARRGLPFSVCDADPRRRAAGAPWDEVVEAWHLGPGYLDRLQDFEVLFRSPGVPALRPEVRAAAAAGVRVSSGTAVFLERCPAPVVGITGTKGKGTTAVWLLSLLEAGGVPARLGGNIGTPPVTFLDELAATDTVILELSSFQLQDLDRSPHGAVLLPVATDHLDVHADDREYAAAKGAICRHQGAHDWVLAAASCTTARRLAAASRGRVLHFGVGHEPPGEGCWAAQGSIRHRRGDVVEVVAAVDDVRLPGAHNLGNACAAVAAALECGVAAAAVPAGLRAFSGLPHRLETVADAGAILWVNDSLATTPQACAAALEAFPGRRIVLIAGGASKGADFTALGQHIARRVAGLVTLGEEGERLLAAARAAGFAGAVAADRESMPAAVRAAGALARPGDVVLLSPACASFGMFGSYAERGDAFRRAAQGRGGG